METVVEMTQEDWSRLRPWTDILKSIKKKETKLSTIRPGNKFKLGSVELPKIVIISKENGIKAAIVNNVVFI